MVHQTWSRDRKLSREEEGGSVTVSGGRATVGLGGIIELTIECSNGVELLQVVFVAEVHVCSLSVPRVE